MYSVTEKCIKYAFLKTCFGFKCHSQHTISRIKCFLFSPKIRIEKKLICNERGGKHV